MKFPLTKNKKLQHSKVELVVEGLEKEINIDDPVSKLIFEFYKKLSHSIVDLNWHGGVKLKKDSDGKIYGIEVIPMTYEQAMNFRGGMN